MGRRPRFVPVPVGLVRFGVGMWTTLLRLVRPGRYAGLGGAAIEFVLGENPYSTERIRAELGWSPPFDTRTPIARSVTRAGHAGVENPNPTAPMRRLIAPILLMMMVP